MQNKHTSSSHKKLATKAATINKAQTICDPNNGKRDQNAPSDA